MSSPARLPALDSPDRPKYWRSETSGRAAIAVNAFVSGEPMTRNEVDYMRAYIMQWIDSPAWDAKPLANDETRAILAGLRADARRIATQDHIEAWIERARAFGVDPL
jgi:hypothetical protein